MVCFAIFLKQFLTLKTHQKGVHMALTSSDGLLPPACTVCMIVLQSSPGIRVNMIVGGRHVMMIDTIAGQTSIRVNDKCE